MKKYYDIGNGTLSRPVIDKALKRLAELLREENKRVELVAAGGVISVMLFGSRQMTRDIDVIIPQKDKVLVAGLVETVAKEQNLPSGNHAWLNDGVSFFGLQTRSTKKIFDHPNLVVFTASWYELLGMKLSGAWRRDADFNDAVHILRQIGSKDKEKALKESIRYKNFSPHTDEQTYKKRFDRTWKDAFE
ncbi:hypothetical protein P886_2010 [Alteromonadaceae bacterium 2753L.S.0a.02]|nr:hypothetical protein P886_2010 [Alteromonadaceae bacterium 2753L.S.0a.02]